MGVISHLAVSLGLKSSAFSKGIAQSRRNVRAFGLDVRSTGRLVTRLGGALTVVAGVGSFGALIKNSFAAGDALAKTSDRLGLTTQALASLQHAATLTGVGTRTMEMGLQRMVRRVAEASVGTGEAKAAIAELGLNAQELAKLPVDKQFAEIADAMEGVKTQSDRVRLAFKLFDSEGVSLINTMKGGKAALAGYEREARRLGLTLSRADTSRLEMANDASAELRAAFKGLGNELAVQLAPALTTMARSLTDAVAAGGALRETLTSTLNLLIEIAATGSDAWNTVGTNGISNISLLEEGIGRMLMGFQRLNDLAGFGPLGKASAQSFLSQAAGMRDAVDSILAGGAENSFRVRMDRIEREAQQRSREARHNSNLSAIQSQFKGGTVGIAERGSLEAFQAERRNRDNIDKLADITRENLRYNRQTADAVRAMNARDAAKSRPDADTVTDSTL